jgi:hypothetical protein
MRILLRLIAGFTFFTVIGTLFFIVAMYLRGGLPYLIHSGPLGGLTIAGWIITLIVGPPAVVLLWKHNNVGRIAAIIVWASVCLYYVACLVFFRNPNMLYGKTGFNLAGSAAFALFLLSPKVRSACQSSTSRDESSDRIS